MLICISANPAIDRRVRLEKLAAGGVNRASSATPLPGGKAAHVAMAARALGEEVMWIGFLGGATGDQCEEGLAALRIPLEIVRTAAATRTNLELIEADGRVTEILELGGAVTDREIESMFTLCRNIFSEFKWAAPQVALSGSLPPGAPADFYAQLIRLAHAHNYQVLLDTSGEALRAALKECPDLVKPNRDEAEVLTGRPVCDENSARGAIRHFFEAGARSVALSLGADGIFWQPSRDSTPFIARPPHVDVRSTVGCGDATLAGFAVAHRRGLEGEDAVRFATACGTANCLADAPGMITLPEVERIMPRTSVSSIQNELANLRGGV